MTRTQLKIDGLRHQKPMLLICLLTGFQITACAGELEDDVAQAIATNPPPVNANPRPPNTPSGALPAPPTTGGAGGGAGGAGGASPGGGGGGGMAPGGLPAGCDPKAIVESPMKCGGAACHGSPGTPPGNQSDLGNMFDDIATRLKDVPGQSMACENEMIINSMNPEQSLLLTKLGTTPQCGIPMPTVFMITDEERACLVAWAKTITGAP